MSEDESRILQPEPPKTSALQRPPSPTSTETSTGWALALLVWVVLGFIGVLPAAVSWNAWLLVPWLAGAVTIIWRSLVS